MSSIPNTVCSSLQHLIRNVVCAKIGVCAREIELVQVATGRPALDEKVNVAIDDRFKLKIPISDQYMTWEVTFNCSLPNCPPDFDLNDLDFFYNITLDYMEQQLPSLNGWDHREDKALINVISELRSAYLKYQVEKLKANDNGCIQEYTALIEYLDERGLPADVVEVFIDNSIVHFIIKLDVESLLSISNSDDNVIALAVRWGAHGRTTSLITSANISRLINTNLELHRNINYDETLSEYTEGVRKSLDNQISSIIDKREKKRRDYIFHLLRTKGKFILSYDALDYKFCSFLGVKDGFVCIVEVTLSEKFPNKAPRYRLLSVYSTSKNEQPLSQLLVSIPFNNSWETATMVEQAISSIGDKIKTFRDSTVPAFKLPKP